MKEQFRFIGDHAEIMGIVKLVRFGQAVDLTSEQAAQAVSENCLILPEETFDGLGFTDEELKRYPGAIQQHRAPADFQAKKVKAIEAFHEFKQSLLGGQ